MNAIEERAEQYANRHICHEWGCINECRGICSYAREQATEYTRICKEQQEIDIQRTVEWIVENLADATGYSSYDLEQSFLKAMKEE